MAGSKSYSVLQPSPQAVGRSDGHQSERTCVEIIRGDHIPLYQHTPHNVRTRQHNFCGHPWSALAKQVRYDGREARMLAPQWEFKQMLEFTAILLNWLAMRSMKPNRSPGDLTGQHPGTRTIAPRHAFERTDDRGVECLARAGGALRVIGQGTPKSGFGLSDDKRIVIASTSFRRN